MEWKETIMEKITSNEDDERGDLYKELLKEALEVSMEAYIDSRDNETYDDADDLKHIEESINAIGDMISQVK